ncbi:PREDICTED: homeodomain-only protein [Hipposideros armiger]|uniref:Homeodomain-only protein n=1 Tax=Hipposideros armiger TaxID=186990 RepID=A0A8B7T2L6_HIPAR|nr:PREDICTED: homeodomain-only protein [Hipposideros armiger]XP_019519918.1 PREDICTED: homeodomain-only protein [Hipposideros armiger]XP_019519919.1 PREDICTED: homeodomain-only protein [Hipposideros armiger]XP_019519920.1 PREDICTED: homeodomain-only protein [Hipposideros armiger]XP_019519921.1 PREDICTED: homeodomain-only protein [Hipposideros armiger]XP_019519922.1 PREDICTED: homeodomain-only protein [Hipposideros armiger]
MSAETASGPTQDQVEILEYNFNKVNKHPDPTTLCLIAAEAGLTEEETQVSPARAPRARTPAPGTPAPPPRRGRLTNMGGFTRPRLPPLAALPRSSIAFARTPGTQTLHRSQRRTPASGLHGVPRLALHPQPAGPPPGAA